MLEPKLEPKGEEDLVDRQKVLSERGLLLVEEPEGEERLLLVEPKGEERLLVQARLSPW